MKRILVGAIAAGLAVLVALPVYAIAVEGVHVRPRARDEDVRVGGAALYVRAVLSMRIETSPWASMPSVTAFTLNSVSSFSRR
jgi:hypothetical protein